MSSPELHQGLIDGDEIALRDLYRRYGAAARALARRIVGEEQAPDVVEEALLLIWRAPEQWASAALDVHVLRATRDLALEVQRRGIDAGVASAALEPFPLWPDPTLPDIVSGIDLDELLRRFLRLPNDQTRQLEEAWFEASRPSEDDLRAAVTSFAAALQDGGVDSHDISNVSDDEAPIAAFFFGLLDDPERDAIALSLRSDATRRERYAAWPTALAAITMAALDVDTSHPDSPREQRLIQRARVARSPAARSRQGLRAARRGAVWLALVGLIAIAVVFGVLAFRADEPISGRAVALDDSGAAGVLLPNYESRLFALVFWGLPQLGDSETWQLWLVRASGAVEPGPQFTTGADGRAAVAVNPNQLESDDALIGFAVSRDDPSRRSGETASAADILYQFEYE